MNYKTKKILIVLGIFTSTILIIIAGSIYWARKSSNICWKQEAVQVFKKYGALSNRTDILRVADIEDKNGENPVEVIEKDPNGCSLGSNGQTILQFYFNDNAKLTAIKVYRNYIASDYKMQLIKEREY